MNNESLKCENAKLPAETNHKKNWSDKALTSNRERRTVVNYWKGWLLREGKREPKALGIWGEEEFPYSPTPVSSPDQNWFGNKRGIMSNTWNAYEMVPQRIKNEFHIYKFAITLTWIHIYIHQDVVNQKLDKQSNWRINLY